LAASIARRPRDGFFVVGLSVVGAVVPVLMVGMVISCVMCDTGDLMALS
jgi:hypothetical protein